MLFMLCWGLYLCVCFYLFFSTAQNTFRDKVRCVYRILPRVFPSSAYFDVWCICAEFLELNNDEQFAQWQKILYPKRCLFRWHLWSRRDLNDLSLLVYNTQRSNVNGMNPLKTFIIGGVHLCYIFVTSLFTRRHLSFAVTRTQKNWKLDDNKRTRHDYQRDWLCKHRFTSLAAPRAQKIIN